METIKWAVNHMSKTEDANLPVMALSEVTKARTFHESFPQYSVTTPGKTGAHGPKTWRWFPLY